MTPAGWLLIFGFSCLMILFAPTIVAGYRRHRSLRGIIALNVLTALIALSWHLYPVQVIVGLTGFTWIVALVWALSFHQEDFP